ncbi:hypothetical protein WG66_003425 [Moniliophthora roreri]|nr:hypothetical protein WG66_003425 [Moniliophthora roreri]
MQAVQNHTGEVRPEKVPGPNDNVTSFDPGLYKYEKENSISISNAILVSLNRHVNVNGLDASRESIQGHSQSDRTTRRGRKFNLSEISILLEFEESSSYPTKIEA